MTQSEIKFIRSLSQQKYRKEHNAYLVEGDKNAKEWLCSDAVIKYIIAESDWADQSGAWIQKHPEARVHIVETFILEKLSLLQTTNNVLLVVEKPDNTTGYIPHEGWSLMLDKIQDPGNMGTIIRTADWFGIRDIICSPDCVEVYNPKVVQSTMGSLLRVNIIYSDLTAFLVKNRKDTYAACLGGSPIETFKDPKPGYLLMGNESKGLSDAMLNIADHKVTIPKLGHAESLNVSVATGIICAAFLLG